MTRLARSLPALALALFSFACGLACSSPSPSRSSPRPEYPGWVNRKAPDMITEMSAGVEAGGFVDDGTTLVGAQFRLGARWAPYVSHDSTFSGGIRDAVAGDFWGLDMRLQTLWEPGAESAVPDWMMLGVEIAADNVLGDNNGESRVRIPSLMGLALPEVGVLVAPDAPRTLFYTAHAFPVYVLLNPNIALEARPSFTLRLAGGDARPTDALLSFSLGLMVR